MSLTVDFFRVRIDAVNVTFEDLLAKINAMRGATRNLDVRGDVLRLHSLHVTHDGREGEMTHIRLNDLPARGTVEGQLTAIGLHAGEGLAEQAAFLYTPSLQVLLLQRNRHSVTSRSFARYVEEKGGTDEPIFFDPILQENAVQQLATFRVIKRFEIRFARVNNPKVFADGGRSTKDMVDILDYFSAPNAGISLSMGRQEGSLPLQRVVEAARALLRHSSQQRTNEVKRIELSGIGDDEQSHVVDLLKFRMVETIEMQGSARTMNYAARRAALRDAYDTRKAELHRMFQ